MELFSTASEVIRIVGVATSVALLMTMTYLIANVIKDDKGE
jgi:hypothetical protein